jgi:DNA mismatch repair protein MutS
MLFEALLKLRQNIAQLQMMSAAIAHIDVLQILHIKRLNNWARPEFSPEIGIKIQAGRHPVVEALNKAPFTPNDTFLICSIVWRLLRVQTWAVNRPLCVKQH